MPRRPRVHYEGALYHVMCRGNNGEEILKTEKNKKDYLELIKRYKDKYGFVVYAYCIMDNHVHILIEVSKTPLSKAMQGIQQVYTQKYNKGNNRKGHVFQQRYKAKLCNKDEYLLNLIRYIHRNSKEAGISQNISYKWSSHSSYVNSQKNDLVNTEFPLSMFGVSKNEAREKYLEFVDEVDTVNTDISDIWTSGYDKSLKKSQEYEKENSVIELDDIIKVIEGISKIEISELRKKSRMQKNADVRKAIIILSKRYSDASNKELSGILNITESAISKILSGRYKETDYLNLVIKQAKNKLISQA